MIVPISTVFERDGKRGGLFIGSVMCLLKTDLLRQNHIGAVLTCSVQTMTSSIKAQQIRQNLASMNIVQKYIPASDVETYDISQHFIDAIEFVREQRNGGKNVLVHCHAGRSRSASIVLAYMIDDSSMDLFSAYKHLKEKRSEIQPNPGFWRQLQKFDKIHQRRRPLGEIKPMATSCLFFNDKNFDPKRLSSGLYQKRVVQRPRITKSFCLDVNVSGNEENEPECQTPTPPLVSFKKSQPIKELEGQQISLIKSKIRKFIERKSIMA